MFTKLWYCDGDHRHMRKENVDWEIVAMKDFYQKHANGRIWMEYHPSPNIKHLADFIFIVMSHDNGKFNISGNKERTFRQTGCLCENIEYRDISLAH